MVLEDIVGRWDEVMGDVEEEAGVEDEAEDGVGFDDEAVVEEVGGAVLLLLLLEVALVEMSLGSCVVTVNLMVPAEFMVVFEAVEFVLF